MFGIRGPIHSILMAGWMVAATKGGKVKKEAFLIA
jgi:hypothetical protein